ncbi:MAG: carboxypeptidase regulatory-like domain-containing protein [Terracidiphilus sp.]
MDDFREQKRGARYRSWGYLALAAVLLAAAPMMAQSGDRGSLEGRLTDLQSHPLGAATVVLRNTETGAEARAVTTKTGIYRFAELAAGAYTLEVDDSAKGTGQVRGITISAGYAAHVQTAVALAFQPAMASAGGSAQGFPAASAASETSPPEAAGEMGAEPRALESAQLPGPPIVSPALLAPSAQALRIAAITQGGTLVVTIAANAIQSLAAQSALGLRIQAEAPKLDPVQPVVTTTISGEQLQSLPLNGRRWEQFALETPATAATVAIDEQPESSGGVRPAQEITLDGAQTKLAFGGSGATKDSASSLMSAGSNEATITELQVADGDGAVGGGTNVNIVTRTGASVGAGPLHGQASFYDRQNIWGAKNPFTQWLQETAPATSTTVPVFTLVPWSPGDRRGTFGTALGGTIRRNHLFWFGAMDGDLRDDPAVSMARHPYLCANSECTSETGFLAQPSNDEMQVLSARLALSSANPVVEGLAAYSPVLETLDGLLGPAARSSQQWDGFGRLDWNAAERHSFMLEATGARMDSPGGGMSRAAEMYGNHSLGSSRTSEWWALGRWEAFLTPNLLSVAQGSMGRQVLDHPAETPSAFEQTLNASAWGQLPQIVVDSRYGFTIGNPARFGAGNDPDEHLYQAQENLDWVRGPMLVRGGFELRHNADATSFLRNQTGTYHYTYLTDFASDALAFTNYGLNGLLNPADPHNCDQRGKAWRDASGQLHGLGNLPCYSYYTQTLGPTDWHLQTDDWAGFTTAQWQPARRFVLSAGLRWEHQDMPPPIALVNNPGLPLTEKLPSLGNELGPRVSLAWGAPRSHWPVLRLGYGMYFGRTPNRVLETALTQTGSPKGDLNLFIRPMDGYNPFSGTSSAPMFPYVLQGDPGSVETPGAVELSPSFHNGEIHQAIAAVEETLPQHILVSAAATASLGRRLPITEDTNVAPLTPTQTITYNVCDQTLAAPNTGQCGHLGLGPIKAAQITVPFYASWPSATGANGRLNPSYQQISELMSRANSTYEAGTLRLSRYGQRGLSFHLRYTYAHAMDWNPNETAQIEGPSVLDPNDFQQEYGTSNLDIRHSLSAMAIWEMPWKLHGTAGALANGWSLSGIGQFHSGLPYTMRTAGSIPEEFNTTDQAIVGLGPGINGYGGDNRIYGVGSDNQAYDIGRNTYRYPQTWKADARVGKRLRLDHEHELELMGESFNLFNHQNVTELESIGYFIEPGTTTGSFPSLNFLTGLKANSTEFGQPLNINATDFYRERQIDFGVRYRF